MFCRKKLTVVDDWCLDEMLQHPFRAEASVLRLSQQIRVPCRRPGCSRLSALLVFAAGCGRRSSLCKGYEGPVQADAAKPLDDLGWELPRDAGSMVKAEAS